MIATTQIVVASVDDDKFSELEDILQALIVVSTKAASIIFEDAEHNPLGISL